MIHKCKSSNSNRNSLFIVTVSNSNVLSFLLSLFVVVFFQSQYCCYCYIYQQPLLQQQQQYYNNNNNNNNNKPIFGIIRRGNRREELSFINSDTTTQSLLTGCKSLRRRMMINDEQHTVTATKDVLHQQIEQEPTGSTSTTILPTTTTIKTLPTTSTTSTDASTTIGWKQLKEIVQIAAEKDTIIDTNGIMWLEHINLIVGCKKLAQYFYINFLGCTSDKSKSFHVNIGQQQFHLAEALIENNEIPQCIYGSIGITIPNIQSIRQRIPDAIHVLHNTQFCILSDSTLDDEQSAVDQNILSVRCPWGNIFHIYSATDDFNNNNNNNSPVHSTDATNDNQQEQSTTTTPKKMVQMHSVVGSSTTATTTPMNIYSPYRMSVRGQPGIRYIEFKCSYNTSSVIGEFYKQMLHCTTVRCITVSSTTASSEHATTNTVNGITLSVGPGVHFVFIEESPDVSSSSSSFSLQQKMIGVHVCIYINEFIASYNRLQNVTIIDSTSSTGSNNSNNGLIWTNPRFVHLDTCDTIQEAIDSRTFRFKDIITINSDIVDNNNNNNNNKLYELEHETRSLNHGQFFKLVNYEPK